MDNNNYYNNMNQNQSQTLGTQQNVYQQPYGAGNTNTYNQNQTYNAYNPYQQPTGTPRKPKKKSGFGALLGKSAAVALVFGLVAGTVFTGVSYVGSKALGTSAGTTTSSESSSTGTASVQKTSTGSASDLSSVSDIAAEAMSSIVAITNTGVVSYETIWGTTEQESESCGSGIIIAQDDTYLYIATNNHVVADAESLTVQFVDNSTVSCEVRGTDSSDDLAVVKVALSDIESDTLSSIKVATVNEDEDSLSVGQGVIAIGNALGYGQSVTSGIISALGRTVTVQDSTTGETITNTNMIQTDAAINPGNSGGALLNGSGEVIGINSSKYSDTDVEGLGYAIPMSDAMPLIEQLIENGEIDQSQVAFLGIQGQDISSSIASAYNMPEGVYVYQVVSGSTAENAGLRQGDIITEFDGTTVSSMTELKQLVSSHQAGDEVTIKYQRLASADGYEEQEITVTLGSQADNSTSSSSDDSSSDNSGSSDENGSGSGNGLDGLDGLENFGGNNGNSGGMQK